MTPLRLSPVGTYSNHQSFHFGYALRSLVKKIYSVWLSCCNWLKQSLQFKSAKPKLAPFPAKVLPPAAPKMTPVLAKVLPPAAPKMTPALVKVLPPAAPKIKPVPELALAPVKVPPAAPKVIFADVPKVLQKQPEVFIPIALVKTEPAFDQVCRQALKQAEERKVNTPDELEACYSDLNRKMLRAAPNDTASVLERYKTLGRYLHFAAERVNQNGKVSYLLDHLQQKYANRRLAIPAEQGALFTQIRNKIAIRRATDPISLPLPGDEVPDENNFRSKRMRSWLDAMFTKQNYRNEKFYLANKEFDLVTSEVGDFTGRPLASVGSTKNREIVTLDPARCPKLSAYYQLLEQEVIRKSAEKGALLNPEEMLLLIKDYVRFHIFPSCGQFDLVEKLDRFIAVKRPTQPSVTLAVGGTVPVFSIEEFIGGPAVCRHHGLVASYLLDRLVKSQGGKTVTAGRVMHMRSDLDTGGAHVWVNFICQSGKYHLDTLWNVMKRFDQPAARMELDRSYGPKAMRLQELRCARAARLLPRNPVAA